MDCDVILLDEPTRGVDVGAKTEIYKLINELAARGLGVVMVSSEMAEIIGMCDRVLVMSKGTVKGELNRGQLSEANILKLAIGGEVV
jgi:ribose transport system ATP-binding protein